VNRAIGLGIIEKAAQVHSARLLYNTSFSLPMKKYTALALLIPAFLGLIAPLPFTASAIAASKISKVAQYGPWRFSIQTLGSVGRTTKNPLDPESTLEASGHWVYARVRITNTSKTRQSAKNLILSTGSTLISSNGKAYDLDDQATGFFYDHLENRPFNPGESREINFFFDTPTRATFQRLEIPAMKSMSNIRLEFK
jgi:hypothetical protein